MEITDIIEQASSIEERLDRAYQPNGRSLNSEQSGSSTPSKKAARKFEKWRQSVAFGDESRFAKRLKWDDLDPATVRELLGEVRLDPTADLPTWANIVQDIVATARATTSLPSGVDSDDIPFSAVFAPHLAVARRRLRERCGDKLDLLRPHGLEALQRHLLQRLSNTCAPTLQSEFQFRRGAMKAGAKDGSEDDSEGCDDRDTTPPQSAYTSFVVAAKNDLASLFSDYPVLARSTAQEVQGWVRCVAELASRLHSDWNAIGQFAEGRTPSTVTDIEPALSDPHGGGQTVMRIVFDDTFQVIYKPRPVDMDAAFNSLLDWLNAQTPVPHRLRTFRVLSREEYGWVEYVETSSCETEPEVDRFFERAGMLLCLVYVLGGADMHYENLIAAGEHPVIVDTEMVVGPGFLDTPDVPVWMQQGHKNREYVRQSVRGTGMLPAFSMSRSSDGFDPGGLSNNLDQTAVGVQQWVGVNTDQMRLEEIRRRREPAPNVPRLRGEPQDASHFADCVTDGFKSMYRILQQSASDLLADDGPLQRVVAQPCRFLFRSTRTYKGLLQDLTHPKYLRSGVDQSIRLDALSRGFTGLAQKPCYWPVIRAEKDAVRGGDVPRFLVEGQGCGLKLPSGEIVDNCFRQSVEEYVTERIEALSDTDLSNQLALIRASYHVRRNPTVHANEASGDEEETRRASATSVTRSDETASHETASDNSNSETLSVAQAVEEASRIAGALQRVALSNDGPPSWMGINADRKTGHKQIRPIGENLYDGRCGIAVFLATLAKVTQRDDWTRLARLSLKPLRSRLTDTNSRNGIAQKYGLGGMMGIGSLIYGLCTVGELLDDSSLIDDAHRASHLVTDSVIADDEWLDVTKGGAGAALALLALHRRTGAESILERAVTCGEHLLDQRTRHSDTGRRGWIVNGRMQTGLAHGAAGFAYALDRIGKAADRSDMTRAAREALQHEDALLTTRGHRFVAANSVREDSADDDTPLGPPTLRGWCRGPSSILLSRSRNQSIHVAAASGRADQVRDAAISATLQLSFSSPDHLCCGELGRALCLLEAGHLTSSPQLVDKALHLAAQVVNVGRANGYRLGTSEPLLHPGLLQGIAGIGYGLLYITHFDQLPNVLLME